MTSAARAQHLVPATAILALAVTVAYLSHTREPAEAFMFPRLISNVMLLLALWNFVRAFLGLARVGDGLSTLTLLRIAPGVAVMMILVYVAAKALGFYVASFAAFLCLYSLYDPASHRSLRSWIKRIMISALFMLLIYALFSLLLKVQTPRGLYF
ncbi:MAG: tripartite tricarboxylate transporter TctB family protein [Granulosicoccus sp.]|nr:tripartite tricarboxylate transporter TctB family protein [Granulosicoccus sp.]